jgi:hypothetical protein
MHVDLFQLIHSVASVSLTHIMLVETLVASLPYLAAAGLSVFLVKQILKKWNKHLIRTKSFPELLFSLASTGGFFTAFLNIHK